MNINPVMNIDSIPVLQRSYLLGLYLTDGALIKGRGRARTVSYSFQKNEEEIADNVAAILRQGDLRPSVLRREKWNYVAVQAHCVNLEQFFPDKQSMAREDDTRKEFFEKNNLQTVENGVAFCAGLLDGDGCCKVYMRRGKKGMGFGGVDTTWIFQQAEKSGFLVDWFQRFVDSLSPDSTHVHYSRQNNSYSRTRMINVFINGKGREALLRRRIDRWSWKVRKFMESLSAMLKERDMQKAQWVERVRHQGMKLQEVADLLSVSRDALYSSYRHGGMRAELVREAGGVGFLVIPRDEVDRLKARH